MRMLIIITIYYISFFIVLYGGVWMTRRMSKSLRERREQKKARMREKTGTRSVRKNKKKG